MINVILLILGLCVLGLLVMIVYAALKPTDATRVVVEEKTPLKLEYLDHDKAVMSFEVPLRIMARLQAVSVVWISYTSSNRADWRYLHWTSTIGTI